MSIVCPVCLDVLFASSECVVVSPSCGHVFHEICLTNWLEEKPTCPTCRNKVKRNCIKRLYLEYGNVSNVHSDEVAPFAYKVDDLSFQLSMKNKDVEKYKEKALKDEKVKKSLRDQVFKLEAQTSKLHSDYLGAVTVQNAMRADIKTLKERLREVDKLREEIETYKRLDRVLYGSVEAADSVLKSGDMDQDNLVMLVSSFKTAFEEAKRNVVKKDKIVQRLTADNLSYKAQLDKQLDQISTLERVVDTYKRKCSSSPLSTADQRQEPSPRNKSVDRFLIPSPHIPSPKLSLKRTSHSSDSVLVKRVKVVSSRLRRPL